MITSMMSQVNNPEKRVYILASRLRTAVYQTLLESEFLRSMKKSKKNIEEIKPNFSDLFSDLFSAYFHSLKFANDHKQRCSHMKASPAESFQNIGFPLSHNSP